MSSADGDLSQWPWYHGVLCRHAAEELLTGSPDGVYLIRDSVTYSGDYTLSMTYQNKFKHYRMKWVTTPDNPNRRITIDNKRYFNNVLDFIDNYSSSSQRGLRCRLVQCLSKRSPDEGNDYVIVQYPPGQQMENRERMPTPPPEPSTEPTNFNAYIIEELIKLNKRVEDLAKVQDRLDMWGRRKILLFHGVSENGNNDVIAAVIKIIRKTLRLQLSSADIKHSHRLGRANNNRPRPILVKYKDVETKNYVWYNKIRLGGTGITVSEFLTKTRYEAYTEARRRFGFRNCWTKDGVVRIIAADGLHHCVNSVSELRNIASHL